MTGLTLRPYQTEAVDAVRAAWRAGNRTPAVVLPTGAGKTVVFSELPKDPEVRARGKTLVIAHRFELIRQAADKIKAVNPGVRVGLVMGDHDEVGADVVVGSVQTLRHESRRERVRNVGTVVVDECHHATAPSYGLILGHYGVVEGPGWELGRQAYGVGFTATMSRGDGGRLGAVWSDVVYKRPISYMIQNGYLVPPRGITVDVEDLDLSEVKRKRSGDFDEESLSAALTDSLAPSRIVEAWQEHADNRQTILFAPTVAFAELMAAAFAGEGVKSGVVHGKMPDADRAEILRAFGAGEITVLCNCMVLTEGTDIPVAAVCVVARPTSHHGLWVQMVGRVLRLWPGKTEALVLDVVGAAKKHSLNTEVDLIGEGKERSLADDLDQVTLEDELTEPETGDDGMVVRYRDGELVVEHVDLFHGSAAAWNRTYRGTWFIEVGDRQAGRYIALIPASSSQGWHVVEITRKPGLPTTRNDSYGRPVFGSCYIACDVPDLGYAMGIAEGDVSWREQTFASKSSGWRKRPMSLAQKDQLERWGLPLPLDGRQASAAEILTRHAASWRID